MLLGRAWVRIVLLHFLISLLRSTSCDAAKLPEVLLQPDYDGSLELRTAAPSGGPHCSAGMAVRGIGLAVKGPPWIPVIDHFDPEISLSRADAVHLAGAGINVVRLGAMMPGVLPHAPVNGVYKPDGKYLDGLKSIVEMLAEHGIYTILEFHQDCLSEFFCGEGLPRWVVKEILDAFPAEFEEALIEMVSAFKLHLPGLGRLEDNALRKFVRERIPELAFPAPLAAPFKKTANLSDADNGIFSHEECSRMTYWQYQLSFQGGHAARRLFNTSSSTFRHLREYWKVLATHFQGNTNVLAFELVNEPFPGGPSMEPWMLLPDNAVARLRPFYRQLSMEIHRIDSNRLVAFSPQTWEEGTFVVLKANQAASQICDWLRSLLPGDRMEICETMWEISPWIVSPNGEDHTAFRQVPLPRRSIFSFHFYSPPELDVASYAAKRRGDAVRLHTLPLLTESCCPSGPRQDHLEKFYLFERERIGWIMWEYKHQGAPDYGALVTGTGPSVFYANGTPITLGWEMLSRPSAQQVRGQTLANEFCVYTGVFNLTFIPTEGCDTSSPDALIVWPSKWLPEGNKNHVQHTVDPPGAAVVKRLHAEDSPYVHKYAVRASRYKDPIIVTFTVRNWVPALRTPEKPDPKLALEPWWAGSGWLLVVLLLCTPCFCLLWRCSKRCYFCYWRCRERCKKLAAMLSARAVPAETAQTSQEGYQSLA